MKRKNWKDGLSNKDRKHLKGMGVTTLKQFKAGREVQIALKEKSLSLSEPCWTCLFIARELGLEPKPTA